MNGTLWSCDFHVVLKSLFSNTPLQGKCFLAGQVLGLPGVACTWVSPVTVTEGSEHADREVANLPNHASPSSRSDGPPNTHTRVRPT